MTTKAEILKAIRHNCLECVGDSPSLVRDCIVKRCKMFPYRMGTDPNPARKKTNFPSMGDK